MRVGLKRVQTVKVKKKDENKKHIYKKKQLPYEKLPEH